MQYLTKERYNELKNELESLKKEGRRAIAERLKRAKEFGDLSENFEYQEAREEQSRLERRIFEIEEILKQAKIIEKNEDRGLVVKVGSKVQLKKNGEAIEYTIVGSNEAQPSKGLISNASPIGKGLLGKKAGDKIIIQTPKSKVEYKIINVE